MSRVTRAWVVLIAVVAGTGAMVAHHSLAQFDTATPVWVKGTVVRFDRVNPHSRIFLEQTKADGQTERWAIEGPNLLQLTRMGIAEGFLKAGDVLEACGFVLKTEGVFQSAQPSPGSSTPALAARPISGHLLVLPNDQRWFWSDYGVLEKCLKPGETKESLHRFTSEARIIGTGSPN